MNIIVCTKQVPGTTQVEIDEKTGVMKRDTGSAKMNPYDLYAIETALRIKEELIDVQITAITMGPPQSEAVLREAYMLGIDHGILLTDRKFGGADCLAMAYTLSQAILKIGLPDLIICGKQTTDGDTAQVGSELAEFLGLPHIACVLKINSITNQSLEGIMDLGDFTQTVELTFPCLITVDKDICEPRLPSYRKKIATRDRPIQTLTFSDLPDQNPVHYGLDGSATRVMRVFPPVHHKQNQIFEGTPDTLASEISKILIKMKVL